MLTFTGIEALSRCLCERHSADSKEGACDSEERLQRGESLSSVIVSSHFVDVGQTNPSFFKVRHSEIDLGVDKHCVSRLTRIKMLSFCSM